MGAADEAALETWLKASDRRGLREPWVWTRREIARRWGIPPPDVDLYPSDEIELEVQLLEIEARVRAQPGASAPPPLADD